MIGALVGVKHQSRAFSRWPPSPCHRRRSAQRSVFARISRVVPLCCLPAPRGSLPIPCTSCGVRGDPSPASGFSPPHGSQDRGQADAGLPRRLGAVHPEPLRLLTHRSSWPSPLKRDVVFATSCPSLDRPRHAARLFQNTATRPAPWRVAPRPRLVFRRRAAPQRHRSGAPLHAEVEDGSSLEPTAGFPEGPATRDFDRFFGTATSLDLAPTACSTRTASPAPTRRGQRRACFFARGPSGSRASSTNTDPGGCQLQRLTVLPTSMITSWITACTLSLSSQASAWHATFSSDAGVLSDSIAGVPSPTDQPAARTARMAAERHVPWWRRAGP